MKLLDYMACMGKIERFVNNVKVNERPLLWSNAEWSYGRKGILFNKKEYPLSSILGRKDITIKDLQSKTNEVMSMLKSNGMVLPNKPISSLEVRDATIRVFYDGENTSDFRSGQTFALLDLINKFDIKSETDRVNPFKVDKHSYFLPDDSDNLVQQLSMAGFEKILSKEYRHKLSGTNAIYQLWVHPAGVVVPLNINKNSYEDTYWRYKGSMFIISNNTSHRLGYLLSDWDSRNSQQFRVDISNQVFQFLPQAYMLSDVEWLCEIPEKYLSSFCIYAGSCIRKNIGGYIRESLDGKSHIYNIGDMFDDYNLSLYLDYLEAWMLLKDIDKSKLKIPSRDCFVTNANKHKTEYIKQYGSQGKELLSMCENTLKELYSC